MKDSIISKCSTCGGELEHISGQEHKCLSCGGKRYLKTVGEQEKELKETETSRRKKELEEAKHQAKVDKKRRKEEAYSISDLIKKRITILVVSVLVIALIGGGIYGIMQLVGGSKADGLNFRRVGAAYEVYMHGTFTETTVTIPAEHKGRPVITIAENAFAGYEQITDVIIPDSITTIKSWAFNETSLVSIDLPYSVNDISPFAFAGVKTLTFFIVDVDNSNFKAIDQSLYNFAETTLIQYAVGRVATSFSVPDTVTIIGAGAFYGAPNLRNVSLPNGVLRIGERAFAESKNLVTVNIPDSVNEIEDRAFENCSSIARVYISQNIARVGNHVFSGAEKVEIFTGLPVRPSGWQTQWNPDNRPVTWSAVRRIAQTIDPTITHTVAFNLNGATGTPPASQVVTATERVAFPPSPTRTGFTFIGWYDNPDGVGELFDFARPVTRSMLLYAFWRNNSHGTCFGEGGVWVTVNVQSFSDNRENNLFYFVSPFTQTVSVSMTITGGVSGTVSVSGLEAWEVGRTCEDDIRLFNSGGTSGRTFSITATAGKIYVFRFGYNMFMPSSSAYIFRITVTGQTHPSTLGGFAQIITGTHDLIVGQDFTIAPPPSRAGYKFEGWYTGENGTGTRMTDTDGKSLVNFSGANNIELYAHFVGSGG